MMQDRGEGGMMLLVHEEAQCRCQCQLPVPVTVAGVGRDGGARLSEPEQAAVFRAPASSGLVYSVELEMWLRRSSFCADSAC